MVDKIAIIDCGTNTFHLLIVSQNIGNEILVKERVVVKIGEGGINSKIITGSAIDRAVKALTGFKKQVDAHGISKVHAFATSAFRNASNGKALKKLIREKTGIDINIISGEEEAALIYHGVNSGIDLGSKPVLVMDIGGGSVEFILGTKDHIFWKQSFEIGAQRLLDLFHHSDPITTDELAKLSEYLEESLSALNNAIRIHNPVSLIGSSGTFDTLSEIHCARQGIEVDDSAVEIPLDINGLDSIYQELISKNREDRLAIPGMIAMRVDMIVVASALVHYLLEKHSFKQIRVSTYALKEGVLDRLIKKQL